MASKTVALVLLFGGVVMLFASLKAGISNGLRPYQLQDATTSTLASVGLYASVALMLIGVVVFVLDVVRSRRNS